MAIGFVEMQGQITRTPDFTTIKHNEDTKGMVEQANVEQQQTKQVERQVNRVNQGDQPEYHEKGFDAKNKGDNEYHGDGGKGRNQNKKQEEDGKVLYKGHIDFSV
jgi:hypothetical protein